MWYLLFFIPIFVYLRLYKPTERLNLIGIQIRDHIYGPIYDLQQDSNWWFDIVLIRRKNNELHLNRLIHSDHSIIHLTPVPVGHRLICYEERSHSYYPGSPFRLKSGQLILYERERKGFGFIQKEVTRSESWPMNEDTL